MQNSSPPKRAIRSSGRAWRATPPPHAGQIPGFVAPGVVDVLEVVDVQHRRRQRPALADQRRHQALALFEEVATVGQPGQEVPRGQVLQAADQF
jgi:hypothetical protein